jgi:hypothetical protein
MYAYKRGLHIIQNNKNDACFCSFWTIWQLFWGFFIYWGGGIFSINELTLILIWFWFIVLNTTFSNISAISWRLVLVVEEAVVPECTFFVNYKGRREPTRIGGDRLVWVVRSSNYLARWVTWELTLILKIIGHFDVKHMMLPIKKINEDLDRHFH